MSKTVNNYDDTTSASMMTRSLTGSANLDEINKGYIGFNCFVVSLGFMQFGVGMNSWSTLSPAFQYHWSWDSDKLTLINDMT